MAWDLFISYARRDNANERVTQLKERLAEDYRTFAGEDLRCFFDIEDIVGMDDWRHRILEGLRQSNLLLLILSPAYLASPYCEWEIVEYLKYEHARAAQEQGVAPVYFVEIPGLDTPAFSEQARSLYQRAVVASEQILGAEHPATLSVLDGLARLLSDTRDFEHAAPLYRRVLGTREHVLGPEHQDTLASMDGFARLLRHMDQVDEAEARHELASDRSGRRSSVNPLCAPIEGSRAHI